MDLVKIISTETDNIKRRIVKLLRLGRSDVRTAYESMPFGIDGNPVKSMVAVYSKTSNDSSPIIIGYINRNQLSDIGELRTFSTDINGNVKFYTWLKNDGTFEIGGNSDNAVRYNALNTALQQQVTKINTELAKINVAIAALGGTYTVSPISLDITAAKITEVKTL